MFLMIMNGLAVPSKQSFSTISQICKTYFLPNGMRPHQSSNMQCPPKVLEQNKILSHKFKKCVNLKCPLQTIWTEDQAQRSWA